MSVHAQRLSTKQPHLRYKPWTRSSQLAIWVPMFLSLRHKSELIMKEVGMPLNSDCLEAVCLLRAEQQPGHQPWIPEYLPKRCLILKCRYDASDSTFENGIFLFGPLFHMTFKGPFNLTDVSPGHSIVAQHHVIQEHSNPSNPSILL
jgi:hypothetical protein